MAGAMQERNSSVAELSSQLAEVQAACCAASQPALQQIQSALAALAGHGEQDAAAVTAELQAVAGVLQRLPPADQDLKGCVGSLGSAVSQLAAGYSHVAAMAQERHKVWGLRELVGGGCEWHCTALDYEVWLLPVSPSA